MFIKSMRYKNIFLSVIKYTDILKESVPGTNTRLAVNKTLIAQVH
jgi:hypothetical protein